MQIDELLSIKLRPATFCSISRVVLMFVFFLSCAPTNCQKSRCMCQAVWKWTVCSFCQARFKEVLDDARAGSNMCDFGVSFCIGYLYLCLGSTPFLGWSQRIIKWLVPMRHFLCYEPRLTCRSHDPFLSTLWVNCLGFPKRIWIV